MVTSSTLQKDYYRYINAITNVLLTFNSAINFLIYCLVGKKFRRIFVAMICHHSGGHLRCCGGEGGGDVGAHIEAQGEAAAAGDRDAAADPSRPAVIGSDYAAP